MAEDKESGSEEGLPEINEFSTVETGSREKLMEVAVRLFAERGLGGVSTRDLAKEAGVNISLISYYFGGKEGLYKTAIREFGEKAAAELESLMGRYKTEELTRESYIELMRGILVAIIKFKTARPHMVTLMMREVVEGLPHTRDVYENLFNTVAHRILNLMAVAQAKGIVRADVNTHTLFFSLAHSTDTYLLAAKCETSFIERCYRFPDQMDEFAEQMVKIFIEGALA